MLGERSEMSTLLGRDVTRSADSVLSGALELSDYQDPELAIGQNTLTKKTPGAVSLFTTPRLGNSLVARVDVT